MAEAGAAGFAETRGLVAIPSPEGLQEKAPQESRLQAIRLDRAGNPDGCHARIDERGSLHVTVTYESGSWEDTPPDL